MNVHIFLICSQGQIINFNSCVTVTDKNYKHAHTTSTLTILKLNTHMFDKDDTFLPIYN